MNLKDLHLHWGECRYSLARSYRENGKNKKEIIYKLGKLSDIETSLINSSRIFRELEVIESHKEAICKHIFEQLTQRNPDSMSSVFYDLSSTTFTGSRCVLMKWGHCKEGYKNHIVLAIVVNTDGLPFYWEVLPGNTADVNTLVWLVDRLKSHFKIKKTTLVFDRGMVSEDNLTLLENENTHIKYITAMNRNQIKTITNFNFSGLPHFTSENIEEKFPLLSDFTKLNSNTYYREMKIEGNRRYILCFNPQLFKDQ